MFCQRWRTTIRQIQHFSTLALALPTNTKGFLIKYISSALYHDLTLMFASLLTLISTKFHLNRFLHSRCFTDVFASVYLCSNHCSSKQALANKLTSNNYYLSTVKRKGTFVTSSHYVRTAGCLTSSRSWYRQKNLVASLATFQSSITHNSLIPGRIEVKLVSMESERSILHVYNKIFVLLYGQPFNINLFK